MAATNQTLPVDPAQEIARARALAERYYHDFVDLKVARTQLGDAEFSHVQGLVTRANEGKLDPNQAVLLLQALTGDTDR